MSVDVTFESTDYPFTTGGHSYEMRDFAGPIPRKGEEIRLTEVDYGGEVRKVMDVTHYIGFKKHEITVYLYTDD